VNVTVEFVVAQGKKELRRSTAQVDGTAVNRDAEAPADITFTVTEPDEQALRSGDLDLSVGFMRGQIKMAGDFGKLLQFLPLTAGASPAVPVASLLG
jgi:hypothetical protein